MKRVSVRLTILFLAMLGLLLSCNQARDVASGGSHLFLTADPPQINVTGTSTLTVTGADENGAPLADGTVISFRVDQAGRVSPSPVHLQGGQAVSTFYAVNYAGDVTVTASSGSVEANATITIADTRKKNVFLSAEPVSLPPGGGTSLISAVVTDDSGKALSNVGVQFSATAGTLQSGGRMIQTNGSGLAADTLNTNQSTDITATTDDGYSGQSSVLVGVARIVCHMSVSTSSPHAGRAVFFYDTSDDPNGQIVRFHWDFGDTLSADGKNVQHVYAAAGPYSVVHSVIDSLGNTTFCDPFPLTVQ
jgi:PKD repeat protein